MRCCSVHGSGTALLKQSCLEKLDGYIEKGDEYQDSRYNVQSHKQAGHIADKRHEIVEHAVTAAAVLVVVESISHH